MYPEAKLSDGMIFCGEGARVNDFVKIEHQADDIEYAGSCVAVSDVRTSMAAIAISGGKCQS